MSRRETVIDPDSLADKLADLAEHEANLLGYRETKVEHLLLALLRDQGSYVTLAFRKLGLDAERFRASLIRHPEK